MRRVATLPILAATALFACGAKGDEPAVVLLVHGVVIAFFVVLGLPAALLLHTFRPAWIEAEARALDRRKTACVLVGAGLAVAAFVVIAAVWSKNAGAGILLTAPALAWLVVGFAGCARRQGERLTGSTVGVRPLVLGWLARAGAFAVPVLWPVLATYLVVTAFGAPVVAMFVREDPPPTT
jgi:hypothetical protein